MTIAFSLQKQELPKDKNPEERLLVAGTRSNICPRFHSARSLPLRLHSA
jgi:hypothetical protein